MLKPFTGKGNRLSAVRQTDLSRYTRLMRSQAELFKGGDSIYPHSRVDKKRGVNWAEFPFASVSVLVILGTLFAMSMMWGGWGWSSWTYAFSFAIIIPLIALERYRKAVITGSAVILLFFMVLIDAGMPGYLGYSPSDLNWYDNIAHYLGAVGLTLFLWAFIWWTASPSGPPSENGARKLILTISIMAVVSFFFEFAEFFSDYIFGWRNFHPGIDTAGDLIFDFAGILTGAIIISRHRYSPLKKPFWHAERTPV